MNTAYENVLEILKLEERTQIFALLKQYRYDLFNTGHFKEVQIIQVDSDKKKLAIRLYPKTQQEWINYELNERPKTHNWFSVRLLETGLLKEIHDFGNKVY